MPIRVPASQCGADGFGRRKRITRGTAIEPPHLNACRLPNPTTPRNACISLVMLITTLSSEPPPADALHTTIPVGVVSFINTLPLIDGLDGLRDITLRHSVPSLLIDELLAGRVEVALCSSIDYLRSPEPLVLLPVGMLGCDGPTMTVRLYSTQPLHEVTRVHCDTDSHTSVALLRILMRELYETEVEIVEYEAREHVAGNHVVEWPDAMLLIGDKVTTDSPPAVRYPHQLDLGDAWHQLTGLPFVFAVWMAKESVDPSRLRTVALALDRQRRHNQQRIDRILHDRVSQTKWPLDLAREYLTQRLRYAFDERALQGMKQFFDLATSHRLVENRRDIRWLDI